MPGLDLAIQRTTYDLFSIMDWLGSEHGLDCMDTLTLDADTFLATFTDGILPAGIGLGKITATGLYGPYSGRANEVQTINLGAASAGTVTINFDGEVTAAIAFNATAAAVQTALELLSNVNPGDVVVTGGPLPGTITLTFGGQYAGLGVPEVIVTPTGLTGGTVTVATTTAGGTTVTDGRQTLLYHLGAAVDLEGTTAATAKDKQAPGYWHGEVIVAKLPTGHGVDAAGQADMKWIKYV